MTDLRALTAAARRYQRRVSATDEARADLYRLIREAHADGASLRAIAAAVGLTFGRIQQIVKEE